MAHSGIQKWLVAVGAAYGCRHVYHYRMPDSGTVYESPYLTYKFDKIRPDGPVHFGPRRNDLSGEPASTVATTSMQQFVCELEVDIYNSEDGIATLAAIAIAAEKEQAIKTIFQSSNIGWLGMQSAVDLTKSDDERLYYHQRMVVEIRTSIVHEHVNYNHLISTVTHSVDTGDQE